MTAPNQMQRHQQLGWAAGSLGTAIVLGSLTSYGLFYMTSYLGIGALLAGQLIGWSKFYDMLTDPLMGHFSDRTHSKLGASQALPAGWRIRLPACNRLAISGA